MAGKQLNGQTGFSAGNVLGRKECRAFTEGRAAKIAGLSAGNNPHPATSPAGIAWLAGLNQYNPVGTLQNRDMSADLPKV